VDRRTITLREFKAEELSLTEEEARQVAACSGASLQVRLTPEGRHELKAGNRIGVVVLPTLNVLIRPKIAIPNVFHLLSYYYGGSLRWSTEGFPFAESDDLYTWLVRFFDAEMERARIYGLARDYVQISETLSTIRGRIDVVEQLRSRQLRPYPVECRYDEYTDDIPLNRALKAAHSVALGMPDLDLDVAARLRNRYQRLFSSVESTDGFGGGEAEIQFTHLTAHWEPAYEIAKLLLQYRSVRDEGGRVIGRAFTVSMDRVFEAFVQRIVSTQLGQAGFKVATQMRVPLTSRATVVNTDEILKGVDMLPDLVVKRHGKTCAVADVKYKKTDDIGNFRQPDVYQLFAYCAALGVRRGLLIYADYQPHITQRVSLPALGGHVDIDTIGIDLSLPWQEVLKQARKAAAELQTIAAN
jgi:5-methylcytosine-specific restriction enzyme subunit McrC